MWLEQAEGRQELNRTVRINVREPLHSGAAGKLLLAYMPEDDIDRFLAGSPLTRFTDATIVGAEELRAEIERIRHNGYSSSIGETVSWGAGFAVPVHDYSGKVVAALAVVLPTMRYDPRKVVEQVRGVARAAANRLTEQLGSLVVGI